MKTVTKDTTIGELLLADMRAASVLMEMGMHCVGCPMSQRETLEEACAAHGADPKDLVESLNQFFEDNTI
jgi:hybrid cluster-associated redox disulfide protein